MLRQDPIDHLARDPTAQQLEPDPRRAIPSPRSQPRVREASREGEIIQEAPGDQALEDLLDLVGGILPLDQPAPELST